MVLGFRCLRCVGSAKWQLLVAAATAGSWSPAPLDSRRVVLNSANNASENICV